MIITYFGDDGKLDINKLPNIVYHATISLYKKSLLDGIKIERGDDCVDFGQGFYTTTNYQQAMEFAIRRSKDFNKFQKTCLSPKNASPMIFSYNLDKTKLLDLNGVVFDNPNEKWSEFIYNNRLGIDFSRSSWHNINKEYDFVYGSMADSNISVIIQDAKSGKMSYDEFVIAIMPYNKYTQDQLSLHTAQALSCLEFIDVVKIEKEGLYA